MLSKITLMQSFTQQLQTNKGGNSWLFKSCAENIPFVLLVFRLEPNLTIKWNAEFCSNDCFFIIEINLIVAKFFVKNVWVTFEWLCSFHLLLFVNITRSSAFLSIRNGSNWSQIIFSRPTIQRCFVSKEQQEITDW